MENKYVYFSTSCYDFYISVSVFNNLLKITFLKADPFVIMNHKMLCVMFVF